MIGIGSAPLPVALVLHERVSTGYYKCYYGSCEAAAIGGGDGGAVVTYRRSTHRVVKKSWIGYV